MGNEQGRSANVNNHDALKPTSVSPKLNKQSNIGYKHKKSTSTHESSQENITKPLEIYDTNELDILLTDIMNEFEKQQQDNSKNNKLCFVTKANRISNINSSFRYIKQLGRGSSCRVFKAQNISNNKIYAIKQLNKKHTINSSLFCQEVQLLKTLQHPNILRYYDCYVDEKHYYIATEYCSGGTMLEKIIKMKSFSERKASQYIKTILSAVHYMHSLNIVHQDIKAQNLVFDKDGIDGELQIIDFGDSKMVNDDEVYNEFVGTINYVPPEITSPRTGKQLKKSDLWSIGVVTYLLVCGRPPFIGSSHKEILSNIINTNQKKLFYPQGINLTDSCKSFIQGLLCYDISDRMSAADALKHEWICGGTASTKSFADDVMSCLSKYNYNNKLQNVLVNAILSELEPKDKEILSEGIISMNRRLSNMDSNSVVNYLLLHSSVCDEPDNDIDWDCLEGLDVDNILNQVEQKEKDTNEVFDDDCDDYDVKVQTDHSHLSTLTTSSSSSAPLLNLSSRSISISKFRAIMDKSDKKYDVDQVVNDLSDENGQIPLHRISSYRKRMDTKDNILMI